MEKELKDFILQMGDNALILGHRLSEWCGHGPELEQDIAMTNIALDLVGQSRMYFQHVGEIEGKSEDDYAYLRTIREYKNLLLVEYPNTDFAYTIARSFFFDAFHVRLLKELQHCRYVPLQNIAKQALKEASYHLHYSKDWMLRLGDGTEVSHNKMQDAIDDLWKYTGEMFTLSEADEFMQNEFNLNFEEMKIDWEKEVKDVLVEATLQIPENTYMQTGGKSSGLHTEAMGYLLADLQYMQRTYPNLQW